MSNAALLNHFHFLIFFKLAFGTLLPIKVITDISWASFDRASEMKSIENIGFVYLLNFSLGTTIVFFKLERHLLSIYSNIFS